MNRPTIKEDIFEHQHVPGSRSFWKKIRSEIIEPAPREPVRQPNEFPPINVSENLVTKPHNPEYIVDKSTPSDGLPPIYDQTKKLGWTTRPPNHNTTNDLLFKTPNIEDKQGHIFNKYKHTTSIPINRGMIEAIEETAAWEVDKKDRNKKDNASHAADSRTCRESDTNVRIDANYLPAPPKCPKPKKHRKHNVVIADPEKMLRERHFMQGDFAPGRPPAHVPESCHSRLAAQIAAPIIGHQSTASSHNAPGNGHTSASTLEGSAAPSGRSGSQMCNQSYVLGERAADPYRICQHQGDACTNRIAAQTCDLPHPHGPPFSNNTVESVSCTSLPTHNGHYCTHPQAGEGFDNRRVLGATRVDQAKEWCHDRSKCISMAQERVQQEYVDAPRLEDTGPVEVSTQVEIDLDAKRQQMLAKKCIEKRRKEAALKKAAAEQATATPGTIVQQPEGQWYQPAPPPSRPRDDDILTTLNTDYSADSQYQITIPRRTKHTHAPTIRVEPQRTWNASAAKRGLGFKSKLRREQEEAARHNLGPDYNDAQRGVAPSTPKLTEEARRRWRNKTIFNQN